VDLARSAQADQLKGLRPIDIPLNVEVYCADGAAGGRSTVVIVDRASRQVTHFVVKAPENEYLVPIEAITASSAVRIDLRWTLDELGRAQSFVKEVPADEEHLAMMADAMAGGSVLGPYTTPDAAYMVQALSEATMEEEQVTANEVAIHEDARIEATDGDVGKVDELLVDPDTNKVSHLVLRKGRLWNKRDVMIPLEQVDHVEGDVIHLKLDKKAIEALPSAPAPKK
jgi:sporulation protein YlmC with PRC-barrel domain